MRDPVDLEPVIAEALNSSSGEALGEPTEDKSSASRPASSEQTGTRSESYRPATLAAQALGKLEPTYGGTVPAIYPAVTYQRDADGSYPRGVEYTRDQNPTYRQAEELLARLEGGEDAILFSSGMAACTSVLEGTTLGSTSRTEIVAPTQMYWGLRRWLEKRAEKRKLEVRMVDAGDLGALENTVGPQTSLVWLESPANPTGEITDIRAACDIARAAGAAVAVDNTVPTPVLTQPLELGAHLVVHSATKSLNGHSDVLAGAVVTATRDDLWHRVRAERADRGSVAGPFEAWLLLRGMRTLYLRVARSCDNAQAVAEYLAPHPEVHEVCYAGLSGHPGHEIARRQMSGGYGPVLSFRLRHGEAAAVKVAAELRCFARATSLGGVESHVEHRSSIEGADSIVPKDLLRLSVGIEDIDDLLSDLQQALAAI